MPFLVVRAKSLTKIIAPIGDGRMRTMGDVALLIIVVVVVVVWVKVRKAGPKKE